MADAKYAFQGMTESMARAMKRDAEVSLKVALEMASFLKGKKTSEAKIILERVLKKTQAIPFKRFTDGVGHRPGAGITAGRYPQKGSEIFIELIKSAEANAQAKGLSTELKIIHLSPQKASGAYHYGRLRRRKFKRANLEIVIQEIAKETKEVKKEKKAKVAKTEAPKTEVPKTEKITEEKAPEKEENKETQSQTEKPKRKAPVKKAKDVQEDKQ
jgi:large subunit ribosomal protein L22